MIVFFGIILIAVGVLILGRPAENAEVLYYDADFESIYKEDEDDESLITQGKPIVAPQSAPKQKASKPERIEETGDVDNIDVASLAREVYDSTKL